MTTEFKSSDYSKAAIRNKRTIQQSNMCACYYCQRYFFASLIREYVDRDDTALCPYCGIDSVIGDASGLDISEQRIKDVCKQMFGRHQ